ncbi:uncharacterized protein N7443_006177 [Penicillium atrosanguineum]|uniref:uncharacterized protein n=1 Tax=Penicillium atrosanguineum TaxID=1132637 RepID=UPI00239968FF|nr:uncharacterized protein N7443_006177 [Penicillium atrosanguineum]KAJ5301175.1 hypothetical protein N7443_006177 [Penicillium atrosanguineum]
MTSTVTSAATSTSVSSTASATCVNNIPPGKNGYLPPESCDAVLYYVPSFAAAILFCALYGLTTIVHIVQAVAYKKGYAWVVIMGAAWELGAFVFRTLQTRHQNSDLFDTGYTIFFLLAPIWINAFLYMTLGRMVNFFLPDKKLGRINARRFGLIFVCLDILAFMVQLGGAALSSNTGESMKTVMLGLHLYMGGIGLQELFILCFLALTIHLHRKLLQLERSGTETDLQKLSHGSYPWRWLFYTIYVALGLITVRIIFRIAQYAQGTSTSNQILTHEVYEYVFDAVPMFLALIVLNVFHPGRILQGPDSKFIKLTRAEKKEKKRTARMEKERKKRGSWGSDDSASYSLQTHGTRGHAPEYSGHEYGV